MWLNKPNQPKLTLIFYPEAQLEQILDPEGSWRSDLTQKFKLNFTFIFDKLLPVQIPKQNQMMNYLITLHPNSVTQGFQMLYASINRFKMNDILTIFRLTNRQITQKITEFRYLLTCLNLENCFCLSVFKRNVL